MSNDIHYSCDFCDSCDFHASTRRLGVTPPAAKLSALLALTFGLAAGAHAQEDASLAALLENPAVQLCLEIQVIDVDNLNRSVRELLQECLPDELNTTDPEVAQATEAVELATREVATGIARFFQPYKDNYIAVGRMRNADNSQPFSGEKLDTKFELGLNFGPFADIESLSALRPLRFGYSQRSWWNIGKKSSPFTEHNYNPEIFWQFSQPERPLFGRPPFLDAIGIEHQSNGQDGDRSRSWDRVYIQKAIQLTSQFSVDLKLWETLETSYQNEDIRHYLGSGEVTLEYRPNERTRVRARLMRGNDVEKISYQADIMYRRQWLNTAFFITYYDGYGEALINYNRKSKSLRAGLYFPLEQLML